MHFKLIIFTIFLLFIKSLNLVLWATESNTDPLVLCSEADRKELIEQFKEFNLDVKFAEDFCDRFAPGVKPIKKKETPKLDSIAKPTAEIEIVKEKVEETRTEIKTESPADNQQDEMPKISSEKIEADGDQGVDKKIKSSNEKVVSDATNLELTPQPPTPKEPDTEIIPTKQPLSLQFGWGLPSAKYSEGDVSNSMSGLEIVLQLKKPISSLTLLGFRQSYRNHTGSYQNSTFSRDLFWEQWQLGVSAEIRKNFIQSLVMSAGLFGGWEENRLVYTYEDTSQIYFSDLYKNGQFWWGIDLGLAWNFNEKTALGILWEIQPVSNELVTNEDTKAFLSSRSSLRFSAQIQID